MKLALAVVLALVACKSEDKKAAKETAVEVKAKAIDEAHAAADRAREGMEQAKEAAGKAEDELEKVKEEYQELSVGKETAEAELAKVRQEAADTVALAKKKAEKLRGEIAKVDDQIAKASGTAVDELKTKKADLGKQLDKLVELTREMEQSLSK